MRLLWALGFAVWFMPVQAVAATTVDDLRALVVAGNIAAVEAALITAEAADRVTQDEPMAARTLFTVFTQSDPAIDRFLQNWLRQSPDSAKAQTAMGWYLWAEGWNYRGHGFAGQVHPDAMTAFRQDHVRALQLADQAVAADPDLLSASDLKLRLLVSLGQRVQFPVELDRVMTRHPNRTSLLQIAFGLAAQWGGKPGQADLICATYAPMVPSVAGYTPQVCKIDMVYWGLFPYGPERDAARAVLSRTPNPVLDYARVLDARYGLGTPVDRVRVLEAEKTKRPLSYEEAASLDQARAIIAGTENPDALRDERRLAVANDLIWRRKQADQDPLNPEAVIGYLNTVTTASGDFGTTLDTADMTRRLRRMLSGMPYSVQGWTWLGDQATEDLWRGGLVLSNDGREFDLITAGDPYLVNAVIYSNYGYPQLQRLMLSRIWAITDRISLMDPSLTPPLTTAQQDRLDRLVICPLMRQVRLTELVCDGMEQRGESCDAPLVQPDVRQAFKQAINRGSCAKEAAMPPDELPFTPVTIAP